jgi:hypothetical protein
VAKRPVVTSPAANPAATGALLVVAAENGEAATFPLPDAGWTTNTGGTVVRFKNPAAPGGISVVKAVVLRDAKLLKVAARASGLTLDEPSQGTVSITLTIGGDVYCSRCTAPVRDEPGRYVAKLCAAPPSCIPASTTPTSTVTSTSTTTSTFVPGVCGNNVVDQPSEECDGTDPGVCDDVTPPFAVACDPPSSPVPCACCGVEACIISAGPATRCCGGAACQDTTGAGMVRGGTCIPSGCAVDAECRGYDCMGGTCCGQAGQLCGVVGCCPNSNATCTTVPWSGAPVCCRPHGATCSLVEECCSGTCTAGACE